MKVIASVIAGIWLLGLPVIAAAPVKLADLAWMAGRWSTGAAADGTQEAWLGPSRSAMVGVALTQTADGRSFYEYMRIVETPAGLVFTAEPQGQAVTAFTLKEAADGRVVFENLAHDYPQRVIYRRCDADLCARIEGEVGGKPKSSEWRYTRMP
jgi:uncharacterized protein DUF6265